ncbi:MerC domain-containing protein [Spongiibacter taiwanensis]|uniref:MerC domain-containing protein n=1 Tax=Spongiibacter taiwanensis TaxID=1748242 RepID=UPI002034D7FE|nr:MerC domain-containing protein [Spongiibacter taiwanensis]USA42811.1 MerC domain-containing protein [Spongiibacter taiwanensis]
MTPSSTQLDKAAIGLSLFCAVHCLLLPVAIIVLPALAATNMDDAHFHQWMLLAVLPTSALALTLGCRQHRERGVAVLGAFGLLLLVAGAFIGHDQLGEIGETVATLMGAAFLSLSHWRNHRLCNQRRCDCHHQ